MRLDRSTASALFLVFLLGPLSGCVVHQHVRDGFYTLKHRVQGGYYLEHEKYKEGIQAFEQAVAENSASDEAYYYLGRCHLAAGNAAPAMRFLQKAVVLDPESADYHYWLGIALHDNGKTGEERACYERAVARDPAHVPSLVCLGHVLLESGELEPALAVYIRALRLQPGHPAALYNRALILHRLGRTPEETLAWKAYLVRYPGGLLARKAAAYLNALGDFEYRNHVIGKRTVTLRRIWFELSSDRIWEDSIPSLDVLREMLRANRDLRIHVVAYQKRNQPLAEARAKRIRSYLLGRDPGMDPSRVMTSWFGVPERICIRSKTYEEDASIQFFTALEGNSRVKAKPTREKAGRSGAS